MRQEQKVGRCSGVRSTHHSVSHSQALTVLPPSIQLFSDTPGRYSPPRPTSLRCSFPPAFIELNLFLPLLFQSIFFLLIAAHFFSRERRVVPVLSFPCADICLSRRPVILFHPRLLYDRFLVSLLCLPGCVYVTAGSVILSFTFRSYRLSGCPLVAGQ